MFLKKSSQEILRDAAIYIAQNTSITNFSAGSIARSIVEAIAPEIGVSSDTARASLYQFAQDVFDQGVVSKATGDNLDLIGGLFSYPRRIQQVRSSDNTLTEEPISDDVYRYEITQIVPSMATANYSALRLALLTINGMSDVIGKEYSHGTGSFSFVIIPQYGFSEDELIHQAEEVIANTKSFGVRPNLMLPVAVPVDLTVKLAFHETTSDQQKSYIQSEAKNKITEYIGLLEMGKGLIYNDLVQEIMNAHEKIIDFEILKFYLNNEPVLLTNHEILEDERLVPQNIEAL